MNLADFFCSLGVRTVGVSAGVWVCLSDICGHIGLANTTQAALSVDESEKRLCAVKYPDGRTRQVLFVDPVAAVFLVAKSRTSKGAEMFEIVKHLMRQASLTFPFSDLSKLVSGLAVEGALNQASSALIGALRASVRETPVRFDSVAWLSLSDICKLFKCSPSLMKMLLSSQDKKTVKVDPSYGTVEAAVVRPAAVVRVILGGYFASTKHYAAQFYVEFAKALNDQGNFNSGPDLSQANPSFLSVGDFRIRLYADSSLPFLLLSGRDFYVINAAAGGHDPNPYPNLSALWCHDGSCWIGDPDAPSDIGLSPDRMAYWLTPARPSEFWCKLHARLGIGQLPHKVLRRRLTEALTIPNRDYVA